MGMRLNGIQLIKLLASLGVFEWQLLKMYGVNVSHSEVPLSTIPNYRNSW